MLKCVEIIFFDVIIKSYSVLSTLESQKVHKYRVIPQYCQERSILELAKTCIPFNYWPREPREEHRNPTLECHRSLCLRGSKNRSRNPRFIHISLIFMNAHTHTYSNTSTLRQNKYCVKIRCSKSEPI